MVLRTYETILFTVNCGYYLYEYVLILFIVISEFVTVIRFVKIIRESYVSGIEFVFDWVEYPAINFN